MPLQKLHIESLRCLERVQLVLGAGRNYLFGPNGAGKTSILEAIHLLGRGRSFRTRQARELVQRGAESFLVSGGIVGSEGEKNRLGVRYSDGSLALRLDGVKAKSIGDLADKLPVHVIEPSTHLLVEGGPRERRRFLDWGVFHVEPGYLAAWRRYRRAVWRRRHRSGRRS